MAKSVFIAEKPSVAREFAANLGEKFRDGDGFTESDHYIVTWCVGHLVSMSYPESYDPSLKKWKLATLPFIPETYRYQIIDSSKKQYEIVKKLLNRSDVDVIYICTDSGREGEYIYRLVDQEAHVEGKKRLRVWIDSQTEEEIRRGIREAKDWSEYDNLAASAYLRAQEDYLIGINFSRLLSLKFGPVLANKLNRQYVVIATGRVMTCVLGMVVSREREIRSFVKTPYFRIQGKVAMAGTTSEVTFPADWKAVPGSSVYESPKLYKENGFKKKEDALELIRSLAGGLTNLGDQDYSANKACKVEKIEKKVESKAAPLLYNLAEIQNACSRRFRISPDQTLDIIQKLYENKLVTYPRTDARVLSSAVAKVIDRNIAGLKNFAPVAAFAKELEANGMNKLSASSKYVNDKQITDHYAIIPTGEGFGALGKLSNLEKQVYEMICRRFLSIFYPPAKYRKFSIELTAENGEHTEHFFSAFKMLIEEGYLKVAGIPKSQDPSKKEGEAGSEGGQKKEDEKKDEEKKDDENTELDLKNDPEMISRLDALKKNDTLEIRILSLKESETKPPSRYNSGSMILAMENAGNLIEDEELRSQIKGSGIGTSATRHEVLKKLVTNGYINLNQSTQIITPTYFGEMIYDVTDYSMKSLLNPTFTASWEKGLDGVVRGEISKEEYMTKLTDYVRKRTGLVKGISHPEVVAPKFDEYEAFYRRSSKGSSASAAKKRK